MIKINNDFQEVVPPLKTLKNNRGRKLVEKDIEARFKKLCVAEGWLPEKFSSVQKRSVPDQIVSVKFNVHYPYGFTFFTELKAPGKTATDAQMLDHQERRRLGNMVFVSDCYEKNEYIIKIVKLALTNELVAIPWWLLV